MMSMSPLLAHAGAGATWQALLTVASLGLAVVAVLVLLGRVSVQTPDDLVVPLASVAIIASLAPLVDAVVSDWVGWAFPVGVVALVALLLAVLSPLELSPTSPLAFGSVTLAVVGGVMLQGPLTLAWHPPPETLPVADDAQVSITAPEDGAEVDAGELEVQVEVTGGSIGPGGLDADDISDPEEAGELAVRVDGTTRPVEIPPDCTLEDPCDQVTVTVEVPEGESEISAELLRGDGTPLAPFVADDVTVTAEG